MKKQSKKALSLLLSLLMLLTVMLPSAVAADNGADVPETSLSQEIGTNSTDVFEPNPYGALRVSEMPAGPNLVSIGQLTNLTFSEDMAVMTEARTITVTADYSGTADDFAKLSWNFFYGGKPISDWKKSGKADSFITVVSAPSFDAKTGKVTAELFFDLPFGTVDLSSPRSNRTKANTLFGVYQFKMVGVTADEEVCAASADLRLSIYESYHAWSEIVPTVKASIEKSKAKTDRYLGYDIVGYSTEGKEMPMGIVAEKQSDIDFYLNEFLPKALEDPAAAMEMVKEGKTDYKIPLWCNNIHADEQPGVDAMIELFDQFATQDTISYTTYASSEKASVGSGRDTTNNVKGEETTVTLNVDEILDNFILVFTFVDNPDGREAMTRALSTGFDPNRDITYQISPEISALMGRVSQWMPATFLDLHGYVKNFLIEPCSGPHDPNYEWDLLVQNMQPLAHAMGLAGTSTSEKYTKFVIPYEDYDAGLNGGWDDGSPMYTAIVAMHYGALGHTVEIPEMNENSVKANHGVMLACMDYMLKNKDAVYLNQLEYWRRGVENTDEAEKVDQWFINSDGESIGRPREEGESFFPDYYVIPVDPSMQKNVTEAYNMVEYGLHNNWKMAQLTEATQVNGTTYPAGTFVIDMKQARRGYINVCLFEGYDMSDYDSMYAEVVINFPEMRGFDCDEIRASGAFEGKTAAYTTFARPANVVPDSEQVVIANDSNDAVKAVNTLLNSGKKVFIIQGENPGVYAPGDFLVSAADAATLSDYQLTMSAYNGYSLVKELPKPTVYLAGGSYEMRWALNYLGFDFVESTKDTQPNVIVSTSSTNVKSLLDAGIPYVGTGANTVTFARNTLGISGLTTKTISAGEALFAASYAQDSFVTAGYEGQDTVYLKNAYFSSVPENVKQLIVAADENSYIKGFAKTDRRGDVDGKAFAVQADYNGTPVTLFANNVMNKGHVQVAYRLIANAVYSSVAGLSGADYGKLTPFISIENEEFSVNPNEQFTTTILTSQDVENIKLYNENGMGLSSQKSFVDNADGTRTWKVATSIGTKGRRALSIVGVLSDGTEITADFALQIAVDLKVAASEEEAKILEAACAKSAKVNETFTITVTTSLGVSKVGLFNENGMGLTSSKNYVDQNGVRVWTLTTSVGTPGSRTLTVKPAGGDGKWLEESQTVSIQITRN